MIREINEVCKKLNDTLGISVILPNPGKRALKAATMCNFIAGTGLLATGIVFSSKCCVVLGGIEAASSVVLWREGKNKL